MPTVDTPTYMYNPETQEHKRAMNPNQMNGMLSAGWHTVTSDYIAGQLEKYRNSLRLKVDELGDVFIYAEQYIDFGEPLVTPGRWSNQYYGHVSNSYWDPQRAHRLATLMGITVDELLDRDKSVISKRPGQLYKTIATRRKQNADKLEQEHIEVDQNDFIAYVTKTTEHIQEKQLYHVKAPTRKQAIGTIHKASNQYVRFRVNNIKLLDEERDIHLIDPNDHREDNHG